MDKVHYYMYLHIASIKFIARNKTRLFLVRSSFLLARTTTLPVVALLSAVLLRRMNWVAT